MTMSYSTEYKILLKRNHLCICCKKQDSYTLAGRSLCYECAEKQRESKRIERQNNYQKIKDRKKAAYDKCVAEHRCVRCGKELPSDYKLKSCRTCRIKCSKTWKNYIINKYGFNEWNRRQTRGNNGLCWQCNKKPIKIGKMCEECYKKQVNIALKSLETINKRTHIWRKLNQTL